MSDIDNAPVVENTPAQPVAPNQGSEGTPASTTGPAETADGEQPQQAEADAKPKRDRSAEKRISRLTQQREAAIREAGYWRGIAEAGTPRQQDQQADGERPQHQQTRQAPVADPVEIEHSKDVLESIREAGEDDDDFDDVMDTLTDDDFKVSRTMRDFIGESANPYALAKRLTENPKKAARIARMEPELAIRALERMEAQAAPKPAPKTTNAPPPGPTLRGRGAPQFDPVKAPMDDYAKYWEQRRAKAGNK